MNYQKKLRVTKGVTKDLINKFSILNPNLGVRGYFTPFVGFPLITQKR